MKTSKRIILIVLLVLIIALIAVGIWQRDNIKSFINSIRYSTEKIEQKMEANKKKMEKLIDDNDLEVRKGGLTEEETAALTSGEITQEEAKKILRGKTTLEKLRGKKKAEASADKKDEEVQNSETANPKPPEPEKTETSKESVNKEPEKPPKEDKMTREVSDIVAELYVVQADFISQLEAIGQQMYAEYIGENNYNRENIPNIIEKNLPTVGKLERECDAKINTLLAELETALKDGGGDLSLVDEIRNYYYEEKSLKKTYYFDQITIGTSD